MARTTGAAGTTGASGSGAPGGKPGPSSTGTGSPGTGSTGTASPESASAAATTSTSTANTTAATETRPQRADARRNRESLLESAVAAFTRDGLEATLDTIAKDAGVGIGTLYRHFPTRESLVEAAYRNELTKLCESAAELVDALPPDRAMREWMNHFTDYLSAKRGMADVLRALIASGGDPYAHSRDRLLEAIGILLHAGAESGTVRSDIEPADVLATLSGVSLSAGQPEQREQAGRLLDLLMDGLRYNAAVPAGSAGGDSAG